MLLWRIEPYPSDIRIGPTLAEDLALHVRYAPLTTVLAQIGSQQQAYVSTPGCAGCRHRRCTPDCRMSLLRRMLLADHVAADLRPIPLGLSERPYTRLVLAVPGPQAQPLDADLLMPWRDARIWAAWRTVMGQRMVGAALAVGADGPEPLAALRERGWIGIVAPQPLVRHAHQPYPFYLPYGWFWTPPTHMLLPRSLAEPRRESMAPDREPIITPAPDDTGVALRPMMDTPAIPFMVAGQVCGVLTSMLLIQALATFATIEQHLTVAEVTSPDTIDLMPTSPVMPATAIPDPVPTNVSSGAGPRRMRRRWVVPVVAVPEESTASSRAEDADAAASQSEELPQSADVRDADTSTFPSEAASLFPHGADNPDTADHLGEPSFTAAAGDACARTLSMDAGTEASPQKLAETVPILCTEDTRTPQSEAPHMPVPHISWVAGPHMQADEVENLMQAIVQMDQLFAGRTGQYGLSPRVMKNLFDLERHDAEAFLAWLEGADLLEAPKALANPWNMPRPLITRDLTVIAVQLAATPLPTASTIATSFPKR